MESCRRYAVYAAPPPGPLADAAAGWLGWDAASGNALTPPVIPGLPAPLSALTAEPARYGFHGTLKAPFRLAGGLTPDDLHAAVASLAERLVPVTLDGLELAQIDGFFALVPTGDTAALDRLAASCTTELDSFRAPPDATETARREATNLTPRQREFLALWGYPYVLQEFRFHMTLTGRMDGRLADGSEAVRAALLTRFAALIAGTFTIGDICVFGQGDDDRFRILHRYPLSA